MSVVSTRKIISGAVLLAVGLAVTCVKGDVPPNFLALLQWIYVSFVAGNAMEHYTNTKKDVQ